MQNYSNSSLYSQSYRKSLNLFKNSISIHTNPHKSTDFSTEPNTSDPKISSPDPSPSLSLSQRPQASTNVSSKQIHPNKSTLRTKKGSPIFSSKGKITPAISKTTNEGAYVPPLTSSELHLEGSNNHHSKDHLFENLTDDIFIEVDSFKDYKYKSTTGIHTEKFQKLTYKILYDLYPKYCPKCNVILSKGVKNRPDIVRCGNKNCHHQVSRLSYTPLHHFKLPIWMFGYILEESILQFPKVITSVEISKRLSIAYKSARLLKQRLQVFSSHQVEILRKLYYNDLKDTFKDVTLPKVEDCKDVRKAIGKKLYRKIPHTDTAVLYSASQRSNQHRKRFRHGGLTASIYQSDSVGGKQVGILVSTIATQNGCVFFDSVPDQKANTLGPLLRKTVPYDSPLFSDEGYPWLWGIYKKHRTVNHQAHSKDKRYKFAKNRWSKFSIHNQVAEGNQRLLKSAFSAYCYVKPTYSQLYLNELSFYKSIQAVGMDRLVTAQREGVVRFVSKIFPLTNDFEQSSE